MNYVVKFSVDVDKLERFPPMSHGGYSFSQLPSVGDIVESSYEWPNGFRLQLKVVKIVWRQSNLSAIPHIYLGFPMPMRDNRGCMTTFEKWYEKMRTNDDSG